MLEELYTDFRDLGKKTNNAQVDSGPVQVDAKYYEGEKKKGIYSRGKWALLSRPC